MDHRGGGAQAAEEARRETGGGEGTAGQGTGTRVKVKVPAAVSRYTV